MMDDMSTSLHAALEPPPEPKRKDKKWRRHPRPGALTKRGPPRPYRRVTDEALAERITKLGARVEKSKKQHNEAQTFLQRYLHEQTYRLREKLESQPAPEPSAPPAPDAPAQADA